jgi:hypothetical protein
MAPDGKQANENDRSAKPSGGPSTTTAAQPNAASQATISQPSLSNVGVRMRAPKPHGRYYVSGATSGPGWYTADASGIVENVHPDHVNLLERSGCVR